MILEFHNKLAKPLRAKATRVLVTAEDGTPICLIVERSPQRWSVFRAGDKNFTQQLGYHGIKRSVVVTPFDFTSGSSGILQPKDEVI